jgi:hypothetical protein
MSHSASRFVLTCIYLLFAVIVLISLGSIPAEAAGSGVVRLSRSPTVFMHEDDFEEDFPLIRSRGDGAQVLFCYRDEDFVAVYLQGSFNDWKPELMEYDGDREVWILSIDLDPGSYRYQFVVRDYTEEWVAIDPGNPGAERDPEHGWVSLVVVNGHGGRRYVGRRVVKRELEQLYGESDIGFSYQRVDGLSLFFHPSAVSRRPFAPSLQARVGYGFKSEEWSMHGTMIQPLTKGSSLLVMLSGYTQTDFTDQTGISTLENNLAAIFFRKDFRDYYRREGISLSLVFSPAERLRMVYGIRADDYYSLEKTANWSLADGDFLSNPAVDEGTMRSLFVQARVGSDLHHLDVTYEICREDLLGGDFEFEQLTAQFRARMLLGPSQRFDFRTRFGTALSGRLPNQKRYVLGGLGTVRGYDYQSLLIPDPEDVPDLEGPAPHGGQRMFLANVEYTIGLDSDHDRDWDYGWDCDWNWIFDWCPNLILFFDTGMVWEDREAEIDPEQWKSSAGIGFKPGGGGLRFNVIWTLDEGQKDPQFQVRLKRMF